MSSSTMTAAALSLSGLPKQERRRVLTSGLSSSHTGRQVSSYINPAPLSCSDVEIDVIRNAGFSFAKPKPMTEAQIAHTIDQFAFAAKEVKDAGFSGVSLHAAHGYLISQFLSPLSNRRTGRWGGLLENRARFLVEVIVEFELRPVVPAPRPRGAGWKSRDFRSLAVALA
jgi:2,4-dienoyl-CoA reductase-like NADH-dependent reductase (Old Yellow Enzyme family)